MNQNRNQNRRRGRGGNRGQGGGNQGNRIDSRARGNAPQLLEKYKKLAHDASLNGDRVQTEYYLQFADHYFRVLSESRARFEDQNPRRQRDDDLDEDDNDGDDEMMDAQGDDNAEVENEARPQRQQRERSDRNERSDRGDRGQRRYSRDDRPRDEDEDRNGYDRGNGAEERLPMDVLPPAIGREETGGDEESSEEAEVRPRRRTRRPRAQDGESEVAPAA